jgi:hypothetical protein
MRGVQYEKDASRPELLAEVRVVLVDHGGRSECCRAVNQLHDMWKGSMRAN